MSYIVYALACLCILPLGMLMAGVSSGPAIVLRAMEKALGEGMRQEETLHTRERILKDVRLQPAYRFYPASLGWYMMRHMLKYVRMYARVYARIWLEQAEKALSVGAKSRWFAFPAWLSALGLCGAAGLVYISGYICTLLFLLLHGVLLVSWETLIQLAALVLSLPHFLHTFTIRLRCPYCYKEIPIPSYLCSGCKAGHTRLWPGSYGLLWHRCRWCQTRLPTLDALGRDRLLRICPECRHLWPKGIGESVSVHIALVGGKAVGKTSYLMTALRQWRRAKHAPAFIDAAQEAQVKDRWHQLLSGEEIEPTREVVPPAYTLKIQSAEQAAAKQLYLYDPGGEAFESEVQVSKQTYYQYVDGIIFLIDALSIAGEPPPQRQDIEWQRAQVLKVSQTYERMMAALEMYAGVSKHKQYQVPIAVAVSKVDLAGLHNEIGLPTAYADMKDDPSVWAEAEAQQVRAFLCAHGLEHLLRDLELQFAHVCYFACSALGSSKMHESGPSRALEPLLWVVEQCTVV